MKDERYKHPAVKAYRELTHYQVRKAWVGDVIEVVGDSMESVLRWRAIVKDWLGYGWNPLNVKGMLQVFRDGGFTPRKQDQTQESALAEWRERGGW